jgi:hypothetical protein
MVFCGKYGHRMAVTYKPWPRYTCQTLKRRFGEDSCAFLNAPAVDQVVVQAFFEALQPAHLDALAAVLQTQEIERNRLMQQWQDRRKRAMYEAYRAERHYNSVDPENRLVAAELERRWEAALRQLQQTEAAFAAFQREASPTTLSPISILPTVQCMSFPANVPRFTFCIDLDNNTWSVDIFECGCSI